MIRLVLLSIALTVALAAPAAADPITGLIAAGKAFVATKVGAALAQLALSTGLSLLAQKLRGKPKKPGLQNSFKTTGANEPATCVVGRMAVKGHQIYHGSSGDNLKWYSEVLELCDTAVDGLERIAIDGVYSTLGAMDQDYGLIIEAKNKDEDSYRGWIRFHDGTQTAADSFLVSRFGSNPDRPWTTDHKLQGRAYAVLTYYEDRKRYPRGVPDLSFELRGRPMYDPRKDSTTGGSGAHRWTDPDTWEWTDNPVLIIYNIMRGLEAPNGQIWGGDCDPEDLPLDNWIAAMAIPSINVNGRNKYTCGLQFAFTDEPKDVIADLLATCNGQMVERGGVWYIQVDAPDTPVASITDADVLVSEPLSADPFPGLEQTYNGVSITHPDPASLWNAKPATTLSNATWEAEDGTPRVFDLQLPAVFSTEQANQLGDAVLADNRRFRRHGQSLPPEYFWLRPLNTLAWTSAEEGYTAKLFELYEIAYDPVSFNIQTSLRERDPSDFTLDPSLELPGLPGVTVPIIRVDAGVPGFKFEPVIITVDDGPKRPGFRLRWDVEPLLDAVSGIAYELRLVGATELAKSGSTTDIEAGSLVLSGDIIPDALYEARPRALANTRETFWDNWVQARAPNVGIGADEFWAAIDAQAQEAVDRFDAVFQAALDRTEIGNIDALVSNFLDKAETDGEVQRVEETLTQSIDGVSATLTQNYVLATTLAGALVTLEDSINASIDDVWADVTSLTTALATTNQAAAQFQQTVTANFGTVNANATSLAQSLASTDQAVSALQNTLTSEIDGVEAWAQQTFRTEAQVDAAVSDAVTQVETDVDGLSTTVGQVQTSVNGIRGAYGVKINNNGAMTGFGLISDLVDGDPVSDFFVDVNNFYLGVGSSLGTYDLAFSVIGGNTYIRKAAIKEADIDILKLAGNSATAADFGQLSPNSPGGGMSTPRSGASAGITIPANTTADVFISVNYQNGYLATPREWGYVIVGGLPGSSAEILKRVGMQATNDQACVTHLIKVYNSQSTPREFVAFGDWYGQNSDIILQKCTISLFARWR